MRELTEMEIDEVDGGFGVLGAAIGGATATAGYVVGSLMSGGNPTFGGALISGTLGAVSGFAGSVAGVAAAAGMRGAAAGAASAAGVTGVAAGAAGTLVSGSGSRELSLGDGGS